MSGSAAYCPKHLVVVHYHLRPGGVRRVIEVTLPAIVAAMPSLDRVTIIVGEADRDGWLDSLRANISGVTFELRANASIGYFSELKVGPEAAREDVRKFLQDVVNSDVETLVWAHNMGLARNLLLARELAEVASGPMTRLVSHHHDFWFENRWSRWPEFSPCGAESLDDVARCVFSSEANVAFATINRFDLQGIQRHAKHQSAWLPNPADMESVDAREDRQLAADWLAGQLGDRGPVWVFPTRFLRRKNIAEAMLLAQWMRPDGWLVTTAAASSADEVEYFERISRFVQEHGKRCRFAILASGGEPCPLVEQVVAAGEAVIVTSIQEGFGLPYLEAAAMGKPLVARSLPNVTPDLRQLGLRFSNTYKEIWVHPSLIDLDAERTRQRARWNEWSGQLPAPARREIGEPWIFGWRRGRPVPFSRLTLEAQLEVLSADAETSWALCRRWNPALRGIKAKLAGGGLLSDPVTDSMRDHLGTTGYAEAFWSLAAKAVRVSDEQAIGIQRGMLARCLNDEFIYPLLW